MLLGILKGDSRLKTKHGLMVGLVSKTGKNCYINLHEEVLNVLRNSEFSMTTREIADQLKDRRKIDPGSILREIQISPEVVEICTERYILVDQIGEE